jgi:Zn-finger nucleic acid-binding protein
MAETVACPGCGAQVSPTGACRFCGATAFVDGVAGRLLPSNLKCPRCGDGKPLRGLEYEGLRTDLCMSCHGVWFGLGLLEEALRRAVKRPLKKGEGGHGPAHGGLEKVRYSRCPVCGGAMARLAFAKKPLVFIDRCPAHGDWCDGGELGQLKAVARSRGVRFALGAEVDAKGVEEPPKHARRGAASDLTPDPLLEELRNRPGNWGLVPKEVSRADERKSRGLFGGRVRRRRDLFDVLWEILDG